MFRYVAALASALLLGVNCASAQILPSQQGADKPASAPGTTRTTSAPSAPKAASLDGSWRYEAPCDDGTLYYGQLKFSGNAGSFRGEVSDIDGRLLNVSLDGRSVSFILEYKRMGTWSEHWTGTLSSNGNSMSGTISDSWSGDCTFTARR